jgi:hypothetical protein
MARARADELRRAGAESALARRPVINPTPPQGSPVTLRFGFPDDAVALARLAALDSSVAAVQPVLVAEVAGTLRAALSLSDGAVVSDPFFPSAAVVELLRARARQLTRGDRRSARRLLRRRPRAPRAGVRVADWN